jgi:YfiH family protein
MNLGFNRGDPEENVRENFRRMAAALDLDYSRMCLSMQTHTANVYIAEEKDAGNGIIRPLPYRDVDGIITAVKNMPLVTFYADCVPLFLFDPVKEVIALSHSGWRGTVSRIGAVTIRKMKEAFGCRPQDILCGIAPSICKDCYEVSRDVADEFINAFGKSAGEKLLAPSVFNPDDEDKFMLDLHAACRLVFLEAGISEDHIEVTDLCTKCRSDLFFSHRVMGNSRGSLAAFASL